MDPAPGQPTASSATGAALANALRAGVRGEVCFDALSRAIHATDASIYEIVPLGVVQPEGADDVVAAVRACRDAKTPIVARGAGTGLTGGAIGSGVVLDLSHHMHRIGEVDVEARTVDVEPGVVLDQLNNHLARHGLQFAPDVATASRATIGGMIANNSCGAHSIIYGRTVDHVAQLDVVLADSERVTFRAGPDTRAGDDRTTQIEADLARIRDDVHGEIARRFPKVLRANGGYGLDRLGAPGDPAEAVKVLCGSEGTLGIVVRARLRLVPIPRQTGLVVLHFDGVSAALGATPAALEHKPAAVELIDRRILDAGRADPTHEGCHDFLRGDPSALLVVELIEDDADRLAERLDGLIRDMNTRGHGFAAVAVPEPARQAEVWNLRKSGLGLLMSRPGDRQPYAFVEDTAVEPARLQEYIDRVSAVLTREQVEAGYYAHASAGCIHVRPALNLRHAADVDRMRRIAESVSDLVLEFGGSMTGEHGDGIVRSCWLEKMYGPKITAAFRKVKALFDPAGLLNPHKIVDPHPMTEHLRYGPDFVPARVKTHLDFSAYAASPEHGEADPATGVTGLAGMCSGVGQCRNRGIGSMCPSYMGTGDERHTTRARANALRIALSNRSLLDGLDDPHLAEVMDLCLSCKACKTECPTGVDMARLKAEYLSHRTLTHGVSRRSRFIVDMPARLASASRFPGTTSAVLQSRPVRWLVERRYRLDRRIPPPRLARRTFRLWFRQHLKDRAHRPAPYGSVAYLVDPWTNYFTPQVGIAAVSLLERAGFAVYCPRTLGCERPAISRGLLTEAKLLATANVRILGRVVGPGVPIVGTEPSSLLTLIDETPELVPTHAARRIAAQAMLIEHLLLRVLKKDPSALVFKPRTVPLQYHAHCHQKAIVGSADAMAVMRSAWGDDVSLIDTGCCGMGGSFGHEVEHYDAARAIGEERLFPVVRNRGEAEIAVSGYSCRTHIEHHTRAPVKHFVEYLADALG